MFFCSQCGESFTRKFNLNRHEDGRCTVQSHYFQDRSKHFPSPEYPPTVHTLNQEESEEDDVESLEHVKSRSSSDDESKISTYTWWDSGSIKRKHSIWLPSSVRAIIVGKSGFGKTTLLTSLLLDPDLMDYEKLVVCGKSLHQPEYRVMELGFDRGLSKNQVRRLFREQEQVMKDGGIDCVIENYSGSCKGGIDASFFNDVSIIPDPCEHDVTRKNLLVLDDVMLSPQNKVEAYFTRGRHNNVDVIYITQSYFRLPRQTIRENGNIFMFFLQDRKNLVHIYNDHCAGDGISFDTFCNFCNGIWREDKHNFVTLDLSRPVGLGKYRKNLNDYWL